MPSRNLILGTAAGYSWPKIEHFVRSARLFAPEASIVLLVGNLSPELVDKLVTHGVITTQIEQYKAHWPSWMLNRRLSPKLRLIHKNFAKICDALPLPIVARRQLMSRIGPLFHHVGCSRFFYYYRYLSAHATIYDRVLLSDVRDVIFQDNPFTSPFPTLGFYLENYRTRVGGDPWNAKWVRETQGDAELDRIASCQVSCAGTTQGETSAILAYLAAMVQAIARSTAEINGREGYDQGLHNHLLWSSRFPNASCHQNGQGKVFTMHGVAPSELHFDADDRLLNEDGSLVSIVHQYDRNPPAAQRLLNGLEKQLARQP